MKRKPVELHVLCTSIMVIAKRLIGDQPHFECRIGSEICRIQSYGKETFSTHPQSEEIPPLLPKIAWNNIVIECLRSPSMHCLSLDGELIHSALESARPKETAVIPQNICDILRTLQAGLIEQQQNIPEPVPA